MKRGDLTCPSWYESLGVMQVVSCAPHRLHMRLEEGDEAAKLFKRFVLQAETSEVGIVAGM